MEAEASIEIHRGVVGRERMALAELYFEGFRQKLVPDTGEGEPALALLAASIRPERAVVALVGGQVVGLAGLDYGGVNFISPTFRECRQRLGPLRGLRAWVSLRFLTGRARRGDLRLDSLVVHPDFRDQGVGQRLLKEVMSIARELGFGGITLEVVDTNPRARNLYERMGFQAVANYRYPWVTRSRGFSGHAVMRWTP